MNHLPCLPASYSFKIISGVKLTFRLKDNLHRPRKIVKKKRPSPEDLLEIDLEFKAEQLKVGGSSDRYRTHASNGEEVPLSGPKISG